MKAVGTLLGLFSLAGLIFAKDAIENLAPGYQEVFAALAAIALAAAAAGTYLANKAAYGWPRKDEVTNDAQLRAFFNHYRGRAQQSADNLRQGVYCTLASVAALLAALMVLWFGPAATAPEPLVKLTSRDGSISCGSLLESGADKKVHIRTADGKVVTIPPASVRELTIVDEC